MTLHTYRCPKCGTTMQVRTLHADAYVAATCQASTYCATRGVVMVLEEKESNRG